jgi:hypothetical protein
MAEGIGRRETEQVKPQDSQKWEARTRNKNRYSAKETD